MITIGLQILSKVNRNHVVQDKCVRKKIQNPVKDVAKKKKKLISEGFCAPRYRLNERILTQKFQKFLSQSICRVPGKTIVRPLFFENTRNSIAPSSPMKRIVH